MVFILRKGRRYDNLRETGHKWMKKQAFTEMMRRSG